MKSNIPVTILKNPSTTPPKSPWNAAENISKNPPKTSFTACHILPKTSMMLLTMLVITSNTNPNTLFKVSPMIGNLLNTATTAATSSATPSAINNPIAMNGKDATIIETANIVVATTNPNTAGMNFNADIKTLFALTPNDFKPALKTNPSPPNIFIDITIFLVDLPISPILLKNPLTVSPYFCKEHDWAEF